MHGAAIVIFNKSLRVLSRDDLDSENFVIINISSSTSSVNLVSAYFKYRTPTATHIATLGNILDSLDGNTIIAMDSNAKSDRWFSDVTDPKGVRVSNFIDERGLFLVNVPSLFHTFRGPRGTSNIDITATYNVEALLNWRVVPNRTSSDHSIIR